jgi:nicotinamide-nucleotide amidase|tara:strand:- start:28 stop:498 length:471 start_codon:yes stop_codon:yes gene_type:complete
MNNKIKKIIFKLNASKLTLSVAESCTGGMLAQHITSVSGASKVFTFGIITYSNKSKINYLKVPLQIIKKYGAVSKQCCLAMLVNLEKISNAKLNIAITGIAGPTGGTKKKPVGLVYLGIKKGKKIKINRYFFKNQDRKNIRKNSVKESLELIKKFI